MAFTTREQALEHFRKRYDEDKFTCTVNKISSGYAFIATPIAQAGTGQSKANQQATAKNPVPESFRSSVTNRLFVATKNVPKVSPLASSQLLKAEKKPAKRITAIEDEPLPDEAIKAVIASRAKRKKPVPYVREELSSTSALNINQHDTDRPRCIYCGDYRSGIVRDHVVSVAWRGGVRHYDRRHTVPSCPQCNNLLGDKPLHNIADRAAFLVGAIEHHERRYLFTVDRTAEELAELDHFLAISVKSAMYEKVIALQRIEYAKQVAAGYYDYATIKHLVKQGRDIPEE
ncbi:TPA: HNH endonuclease [Klebsiella michiganensis]|nr:HNH endonuclease [Klebsiella michiganensis]HDX9093493.1 HNH endonuclease [Klebsiella michiganensis]